MWWTSIVTWLSAWWADWFGWWAGFFGLCLLLVAFTGCNGVNPALTDEQNELATDNQMAWVDKAVEVAKKHNLAYHLKIGTTGRPSVGVSTDFYLDSGLTAELVMFGNGGSDDEP